MIKMNWEKIIKENPVEALEGVWGTISTIVECEWPQCKNDADWICHKCNIGLCESHFRLGQNLKSVSNDGYHKWVNKHNPTKKPFPRKKK